MKELVSINGQIFRPEEARISVFDRGFLYGDSVYEVARSYGRVLFALEEHLERLYLSASRIALNIGFEPKALQQEIYRVYNEADRDDVYMRIVVTRGEGRIALDPNAAEKPNVVIYIKDIEKVDLKLYGTGIDVIAAQVLRNSKDALDPNIKSGNYLNNILALGEAKQKKAHDAFMVNREGFVTEGTTWNLFMVKGGEVITPPDKADILHGITRKILRKLCSQLGIKVVDRFFTVAELKAADEAFSTGSVKEVMPISSVDGAKIADGKPGPVTLKLASAYKEYVKVYCDKYEG
jgi:branched-chain amino acid aminotransferase